MRRRRSRWRADRTAEAAARTEAGPRLPRSGAGQAEAGATPAFARAGGWGNATPRHRTEMCEAGRPSGRGGRMEAAGASFSAGTAASWERGSVAVIVSPFPTGSGSLFRAYPARARARVGAGAVRAPDCAREAEGALLPSASHRFSEMAPPGRAAPGRRLRVRFPGDHHTTIRQMSSPYRNKIHEYRKLFMFRAGNRASPATSADAEAGPHPTLSRGEGFSAPIASPRAVRNDAWRRLSRGRERGFPAALPVLRSACSW